MRSCARVLAHEHSRWIIVNLERSERVRNVQDLRSRSSRWCRTENALALSSAGQRAKAALVLALRSYLAETRVFCFAMARNRAANARRGNALHYH